MEPLNNIHDEIREEAIKSKSPPSKIHFFFRVMIGLFIILIMVLWVVPKFSLKYDPNPRIIPKFAQVFGDQEQLNIVNISDYESQEYGANNNNTPDTIYDFNRLIDMRDPFVKLGADRISSLACTGYDNYKVCQAKAIFYFVRDEFLYSSDPLSFEFVKTPRESIIARSGDCDDAAVLLISMLGSVGIQGRLVFIPGHVYVEAYLPDASKRYKTKGNGEYVALDATCHGCNFGETPYSTYKAVKNYLMVDI